MGASSRTTRPVTCAMPMATTGTTMRPPICCATRMSLTRVEMSTPRFTDSSVNSGTIKVIAASQRGDSTAFCAGPLPTLATARR